MKLAAASILPGAKGRLLPASIPFAFFGATIIFHVLLWLVAIYAADEIASFGGGLGHPLGALHFLTLGVLASTAMGASFQLLLVATRRGLLAVWPARLAFFLYVPGILSLVHGMGEGRIAFLTTGGVLVAGSMTIFVILVADNLRRSPDLGAVAAHGWGAVASLVLLLSAGLALVFDFARDFLPNHRVMALAHTVLGLYGFMGTLMMGFSYILVPMFALAEAVSPRQAFASFGIWIAAVAVGVGGALAGSPELVFAAAALGLLAALLHIAALQRVMGKRMRKRLGVSFVLVRAGWVFLLVGLVLGGLTAIGVLGSHGPALFGFVTAFGWLLTFLLGILQRILPFLASMHTAKGSRLPLVSELTNAQALTTHAVCHFSALVVIIAGIALDLTDAIRGGAVVGLAGAISFAWFGSTVIYRLMRQPASGPARSHPTTERWRHG